jgi:hypothetical protein
MATTHKRHDADRERFEDGQDKVRPLPGQEGKRRNQHVGRRWIDRNYAHGRFGESFARDSCLRDVIRIASVTPQPTGHERIGEVVLARGEAWNNATKNQIAQHQNDDHQHHSPNSH